MANELLTILEYIEQERGISRAILAQAVEKALMTASRKSIHPAKDLIVKVDKDTGDIKVWAKLEVVDAIPNNDQIVLDRVREKMPDAKLGDIVEWEVTPSNFGRIAAQTARQAIMQQLRKAEKEIVRDEFIDKVGHIVNGVVRRIESGNIIVDLGKAEGILGAKHKIFGEHYMPGDRINAILLKVDTLSAGPSLILSRTSPDFVRRLFEREVSEIHDGVVEIMGIAREAGSRSKIAVRSSDPRVDPIGACVGMRGMRVKNITTELGGERVDIIRFDDDIRAYAINAMQPAKPTSIQVDNERKTLVVMVTRDQSKLAYGKKAQNVRLCSKLLGWSINIQCLDEEGKEETFEEKIAKAIKDLSEALDVEPSVADVLVSHGFLTIEGLRDAGEDEIRAVDGLDDDEINQILSALE